MQFLVSHGASVCSAGTSPWQSPWRPLTSSTPLWTTGSWWTVAAVVLGSSCTTGPPTTGTLTPCWTSDRWRTATANQSWRRSNPVRKLCLFCRRLFSYSSQQYFHWFGYWLVLPPGIDASRKSVLKQHKRTSRRVKIKRSNRPRLNEDHVPERGATSVAQTWKLPILIKCTQIMLHYDVAINWPILVLSQSFNAINY